MTKPSNERVEGISISSQSQMSAGHEGPSSAAIRKVVVNRCYGGFGLSEAAIYAYAARKGLTLYPEPMFRSGGLLTYWTVPVDQRPAELEGEAWYRASLEERRAHNAAYEAARLYDKDIPRDDPDLVAVVEELGAEAASGNYAQLDVAAVPADVSWRIEEYDGREWVAEEHRTW